MLVARPLSRVLRVSVMLYVVIGVCSSIYFMYVQLSFIQAVCIYCIISGITTVLLLVAAVCHFRAALAARHRDHLPDTTLLANPPEWRSGRRVRSPYFEHRDDARATRCYNLLNMYTTAARISSSLSEALPARGFHCPFSCDYRGRQSIDIASFVRGVVPYRCDTRRSLRGKSPPRPVRTRTRSGAGKQQPQAIMTRISCSSPFAVPALRSHHISIRDYRAISVLHPAGAPRRASPRESAPAIHISQSEIRIWHARNEPIQAADDDHHGEERIPLRRATMIRHRPGWRHKALRSARSETTTGSRCARR